MLILSMHRVIGAHPPLAPSGVAWCEPRMAACLDIPRELFSFCRMGGIVVGRVAISCQTGSKDIFLTLVEEIVTTPSMFDGDDHLFAKPVVVMQS
jgi:hypothetical protein